MSFILQDPDESLTHSVDWVDWLPTGDAVASASWAITPTGPTVTDLGESGTIVSADVSGCTRGVIYRLTCDMVSDAASAETGQQSIMIRCDHK